MEDFNKLTALLYSIHNTIDLWIEYSYQNCLHTVKEKHYKTTSAKSSIPPAIKNIDRKEIQLVLNRLLTYFFTYYIDYTDNNNVNNLKEEIEEFNRDIYKFSTVVKEFNYKLGKILYTTCVNYSKYTEKIDNLLLEIEYYKNRWNTLNEKISSHILESTI